MTPEHPLPEEVEKAYRPRELNAAGQCCGRKPLVYKRDRYLFCTRCCAAFDLDGKWQMTNWAWKRAGDHFYPKYPESEYVTDFSRHLVVSSALAAKAGEGNGQ
jgi:hypothetical protein